MKNYAIVGFIYNHPCPLKCNFCCHTAEVVGPGKLTPEKVAPVIERFAVHDSVVRFAFSGGDPFLFLDEIMLTMKTVREAGVTQPFHMVTSGYWADSDEVAMDILRPLFDLGMDNLCLSFDREHAKYVPVEYIYRIERTCVQLGIKLEVFGVFWDEGDTVEKVAPGLTHAKTYSDLAMPIGAARNLFLEGARYQQADSKKFSCGKPKVYDVAIYPNGDVFPCCSGGFNKEAKLECGNVFRDESSEILNRVFTNFHVRIAKEIGFNRLYDIVREKRPDLYDRLTPFEAVDSVCEICRNIHASEDLRADLREVYEEMEIDYVLSEVDKDWAVISQQGTSVSQQETSELS